MQLARFCAATYVDGHEYFSFDPVHDIEAAAMTRGDTLVVAFRGTELGISWGSLWDVIRDLRVWPWKSPHGWVHAGFYHGARTWASVHDEHLLARFPGCTSLVLTGHSLGAALAAQFAMITRHKVTGIALFGEPRGFYGSSARAFEEKKLDRVTVSYCEGNDLVTRSPPWGRQCVGLTKIGYDDAYDHDIHDYIDALNG